MCLPSILRPLSIWVYEYMALYAATLQYYLLPQEVKRIKVQAKPEETMSKINFWNW